MRHHDALRDAGGAGRVDQVRGIVEPHRAHPIGVGDRAAGQAPQLVAHRGVVEHHPVGAGRQRVAVCADGQSDDGTGVGEHVLDAVRRVVRVHGHEGGPGLGDRPGRGHRFDRPGQRQRDHRLGTDAAGDEQPREPIRVRIQVAVTDLAPLEHHRGGSRIDDARGRQQLGQRTGRHAGAAAHRGDRGPLGHRQQVDVAHPHRRVVGDGAQHRTEPFGEAGDRRGVEQVGRIRESGGDTGRFTRVGELLGEGELQVEVGGVGAGVDDRDGQAGQLEPRLLVVAELEHHLEQRRVRGGSFRGQCVHEPLERQVGVPERVEVAVADGAEQLRVGGGGIEPAAQHECVDEHADHVVERGGAATGDRGADRDVVGVAEPGEQRRQGGVHRHEHGRVVTPGDCGEAPVHIGTDPEPVDGALQRTLRRARPVGGQVEDLRQPVEGAGPVLELAGQHAVRVVGTAQHLLLPQRVVRVLHRERRPVRGPVLGPGDIRAHHVSRERCQGEPVGADVVHDDDEHVLLRAHAQQQRPHGRRRGDVEALRRELGDPLADVLLGGGHRFQVGGDGRGRHDQLGRFPVDHREPGAQRLVPLEDVGDGRAQRAAVEVAVETDGQHHVVGGGGRVELVDEPHPLLRQRHRDDRGARRGRQRRPRGTAHPPGLDPQRERGDGRGVEDVADPDVRVEGVVDAGHQPSRGQRVPAEVEEAVVHAHSGRADQFAEDQREDLLDGVPRRHELGLHGAELGGGQRTAVQLAGGSEGEIVEHEDLRRHHVRGQRRGEGLAERGRIDVGTRIGDDVTDEGLSHEVVVAHHDHRLCHARPGEKRRLHLAELDAQATQLHLEVGAAQVVERVVEASRLPPAHQVAGAVQPRTGRAERVGDEPFRREIGTSDVSAGQLDAGQVELAGHPHRGRVQPRIEHVRLGVPHRDADRDRHRVGGGVLPVGDVDGGLGGAVQVVQFGTARADEVREGLRGGGRQRLATAEHGAQRPALRRIGADHEGGEHRRHEVRDGDAPVVDELRQVGGVAMPLGQRDRQTRAGLQRPEELPHRDVERGGCLLHDDVGAGEPVPVLHPGQTVDDRAMADGHTLGPAGRTRRVDHVRDVVGPEGAAAFLGTDGAVVAAGEVEPVDLDDLDRVAEAGVVPAGRQHTHRLGTREHVVGAFLRMVRVERYVRAAGLGHRVHADQQVERAAHRQRDPALRPHAAGDQLAGEASGAGCELRVRELLVTEGQGHRVRGAPSLRVEQVGQRCIRHRVRGGVPLVEEEFAFAVDEDVDVADPDHRVDGDGLEDPQEPLREHHDGAGIEQVCRVGQPRVDRTGAALHIRLLGQDHLEIELGCAGVDLVDLDGEFGKLEPMAVRPLQDQHHLEQRRVGLRAGRVEDLDEPLERHVGVAQGCQIGGPGVRQQIAERPTVVHPAAQHQRVDEHADQIVEFGLAAPGHRRPDRDVARAAGPGQQHGQGRVQHHEQARLVLAGQFEQSSVQVRRDRDVHRGAAHRLLRRPGPVGGQLEQVGRTGQFIPPERDLTCGEAPWVVLRAQQFPLPYRVVGVLHRERCPGRVRPCRASPVRDHHVPSERRHRQAVRRHVVHDE